MDFRTLVISAHATIVGQLRRDERIVPPVPTSLDVLAEVRRSLPDTTRGAVVDLCRALSLPLADDTGEPPTAPNRRRQ